MSPTNIDESVIQEYLNEAFPLHRASREGLFDVLEVLISKHGLNPNSQTFDMVTALHEASAWGHTECVKLLIKLDASINARNIDGSTPLCDASSHGRKDCVRILLDAGALVNPPLLLTSPLHEAVFNDNWECAEMLIEAGADLHANDIHFGTPLHVASLKGHYKCAEVLLRAGANVNMPKMHQTALHEALKQGWDTDFLKLLLEHGANVNYINNQGLTSKDLAQKHSQNWDLLNNWERTPQSLMFYARKCIRQCIKNYCLISKLDIPEILQNYLNFR